MSDYGPQITRSRAMCMTCLDVIESKHRHDFKYCKCSKIFLDGGNEYVRYGAPTLSINHIQLFIDYEGHPYGTEEEDLDQPRSAV